MGNFYFIIEQFLRSSEEFDICGYIHMNPKHMAYMCMCVLHN